MIDAAPLVVCTRSMALSAREAVSSPSLPWPSRQRWLVASLLVIEPEVSQLAAAIERLLGDPQLRQEMGSNGRRLVSEKFTWDKVAEQMRGLYETVLKQG